jgi:hypothetical protein
MQPALTIPTAIKVGVLLVQPAATAIAATQIAINFFGGKRMLV